jgi:hypothetical protein
LIMPEQVFADPRPYVHFTTVPIMSTHCDMALCPVTSPSSSASARSCPPRTGIRSRSRTP